MTAKADILARLQRDILTLQGCPLPSVASASVPGLDRIQHAFPNGVFPFAAVHEFLCYTTGEVAASGGFIAGLLSTTMQQKGAVLWVSASRLLFPPALKAFGIRPEQVIFLDLKKEKEVPQAIEEALRCRALSAVVGEMPEMSFTTSRRFQLAIEKSGVSCFVLRQRPKNTTTTAVARWQIKPLRSYLADGLPGVGHPRWQVSLLKVRNGKPGSWEVEWVAGRFRQTSRLAVIQQEAKKKTG